jgi:hypothetical protein
MFPACPVGKRQKPTPLPMLAFGLSSLEDKMSRSYNGNGERPTVFNGLQEWGKPVWIFQ